MAKVPVTQGPAGPRPKVTTVGAILSAAQGNASLMGTVGNGKPMLNLASFNFSGLSGNEEIKEHAIETLRKYGLGSCGPPGFYGTLGEPRPPCFISIIEHWLL